MRKTPDLVGEAELSLSLGHFEEAIEKLRQFVSKKPGAALAHIRLATALAQANMTPEAINECRTALSLAPKDADVARQLGLLLEREGKWDEAANVYEETLRRTPSAMLHRALGLALEELKKPEEAIVQYQEAILIDPDDPNMRLNLGVTLDEAGRYAEAVDAYQTALRLEPDHMVALYNLALTFRHMNKAKEAEACFNTMVQAAFGDDGRPRYDPDSAYAYFVAAAYVDRSLLLEQQGKLEEAAAELQQAIRLRPEDADLYRQLGKIFDQRGLRDDAIAARQQAIRLEAIRLEDDEATE
jgi:tetratricopeptide (TPR) repeat protein